MSNCGVCGQDYTRCNCVSQQPYCEQCGGDSPCVEIMDSACVIYHPDNDKPSKLDNLGMPNGSSAEEIFEAIDDLVGGQNIPLNVTDTTTIDLTATGPAKHNLKADVIISPDANNQIEVHVNGLYVGNNNEFKVKVDATDAPEYLENQVVGDTDGIISISIVKENGKLKFVPTICIEKLIQQLDICSLIAQCNICEIIEAQGCIPVVPPEPTFAWEEDTYECAVEDLDLVSQKTITSANNPLYVFEDNGRVYVVSQTAPSGKIYSFNPATANTMGDVTYLTETRSGQPYGPTGGSYVSGTNYKAVNTAAQTEACAILGAYYDKPTRTLFVHSTRTFGMDYYDFATAQWGKVGIGSTGSVYNVTNVTTDFYTHIAMFSSDSVTYLITGWGTSNANRGSKVITVDKATRTMVTEVDTLASPNPFAPTIPLGNPFNTNWVALFTADNRMFISKGSTPYRDVAVFNSSLTPLFELVLANSSVGYGGGGGGGRYWAASYLDAANNKFYYGDFFLRTLDVYDTNSYALLKTFNLDNNRAFPKVTMSMSLLETTQELFINLFYGDNDISNLPDGTNDSLLSDTVTYKLNRATLEIEKIYIGQPRTSLFETSTTNQFIANQGVGAPSGEITSPSGAGSILFYVPNPSGLFTGFKTVLTLREYDVDTAIPTGNTKPNLLADPDYIPPGYDYTACPVSYTLNPPDAAIVTVKNFYYDFEFGLNADVYSNPAIGSIDVVMRNTTTASTIATTNFTLPNTPNLAAFFRNHTIATGTIGNTWAMDIIYKDPSAVPIATFNNFVTGTILA